MRHQNFGFVFVLISCILNQLSTSTLASVISTLNDLEEVDDALLHSQLSLNDLNSLVSEVITTDATTNISRTIKTTEETTSLRVPITTDEKNGNRKRETVNNIRKNKPGTSQTEARLHPFLVNLPVGIRESIIWNNEEISGDFESEDEDTSTTEIVTSIGTDPSTTPDPWQYRVYSVLDDIRAVTSEISNGQVDHEHAYALDQLATSLDSLVKEGANDTSVLEGINQEDLNYINSIISLTDNTRNDIKNQINNAKKDKKEMIVAITMLSILFVLVMVGLVFAMIRPWAGGCRLPMSKKKMRSRDSISPVGDSSYLANVTFQDRSYQMGLQERTSGREVAA